MATTIPEGLSPEAAELIRLYDAGQATLIMPGGRETGNVTTEMANEGMLEIFTNVWDEITPLLSILLIAYFCSLFIVFIVEHTKEKHGTRSQWVFIKTALCLAFMYMFINYYDNKNIEAELLYYRKVILANQQIKNWPVVIEKYNLPYWHIYDESTYQRIRKAHGYQ